MRSSLTLLLFILATATGQAQTCTISVSATKGCVPQPIQFSVVYPQGKTPQSHSWDFGNGSSSVDPAPTHIYQDTGAFVPSVIINFTDGTSCTATYHVPILIFDSPEAVIVTPATQALCANEPLCFDENSIMANSGAPIHRWNWVFGDGGGSLLPKPCHLYSANGTYSVTLEVTDTNGCRNLVRKDITLKFSERFKPVFDVTLNDSCPLEATLINLTDTTGMKITKFFWIYGDGSIDSCDFSTSNCSNLWTNTKHIYNKPGNHYVKLVFENEIGCRDTTRHPFPIFFQPPIFDITAFPSGTMCFDGPPLVQFNQPVGPLDFSIKWNFGDPGSLESNEIRDDYEPSHLFSEPGSFDIYLKIKSAGCIKDTTYCGMVNITGPLALINYPPPASRNSYRSPQPFPTGGWPQTIDNCLDSVVHYSTLDTVFKPGGNRVEIFCNADTANKTITKTRICGLDTLYEYGIMLKPSSVVFRDTTEIVETKKTWIMGQPLPSGQVFQQSTGFYNPQNIHDSDLYSCTAPNWVHFVNNTVKHRGYKAMDDIPPGFPDVCKNPSYGSASDSLIYFWDFDEGTSDTSTEANPDERARYSTRKVPVHKYVDPGCYAARLTVIDTVAGCTSAVSQPLTIGPADAGWAPEFDTIQHMTHEKQKELEGLGFRRGMILNGPNCVDERQKLNLSEILPICEAEDYWVVFDSADHKADTCGSRLLPTHDWIGKDMLEVSDYTHIYHTPGWKTIGFVVKNGDCIDTAWYHNYKYIHGFDPTLNLNPKNGCPGDTFRISPRDKLQPGIKLFILDYFYQAGPSSSIDTLKSDTLSFRIINGDTITTSVHDITLDINDPDTVNGLLDTVLFSHDRTGVFTVRTRIISRFGCNISEDRKFFIGHNATIIPGDTVVCIGDSVLFTPRVNYYTFNKDSNVVLENRLFWFNPIGLRNGRVPDIVEEIKWDLDGDSIPDDSIYTPTFKYDSIGSYTIRVFTKDSSGCDWQVKELKDFIKVVGVSASFTVDSPGATRICAPQIISFTDNSTIQLPESGLDSIVEYEWDFGDGSAPLLKTDSTGKKVSHVFLHNGEFTVTLTVRLFNSNRGGPGCTSTFTRKVTIQGPTPRFKIIGDSSGCFPFTVTVVDFSTNGSVKEWKLGDGRTYQPKAGEDTLTFTYGTPGVYCLELFAGDSVRDDNDSIIYCTDFYPFNGCDIQVTVLPPNEAGLIADEIVCVNFPVEFRDASDTSYSEYSIDYGDGNTDSNSTGNFEHVYNDTGTYIINYYPTGASCNLTVQRQVKVVDVLAFFTIDSLKSEMPMFTFKNESKNANSFVWTVDDGSAPVTFDHMGDFFHSFQEAGEIEVCLLATNAQECVDTFCRTILIDIDLFIPNVFTPGNNDGYNDNFVVRIKGHTYYHLKIYNRWGEKVFESNDSEYTWNGRMKNDGQELPAGGYYFLFNYSHLGGTIQKVTGTVTLIR
ncbi:MAG: PKD domain-containing protein [Bacteroidia bacterium]